MPKIHQIKFFKTNILYIMCCIDFTGGQQDIWPTLYIGKFYACETMLQNLNNHKINAAAAIDRHLQFRIFGIQFFDQFKS